MTFSQRIAVLEESQVGAARRAAGELARELGGSAEWAGRCSIVASEAAGNLFHHGGGGELILRKLRPEEGSGLDVLALDRGAGMASVTECLRDGFSTRGTAGAGLGALRRLSSAFEITSSPGHGTALWSRLRLPGAPVPARPGMEIGAVSLSLAGEAECGDQWETAVHQGVFRVMLADGLGHGAFAATAAREAIACLRGAERQSLTAIMEAAHERLRATRGAAVSMVEVLPHEGRVTACGVGNVSMGLVYDDRQQSLLSQRGTVGGVIRKIQELTYPWQPGALLVLHSDGLSTQWHLDRYPGLLSRHPALIAGVLYRDFRRERDDATVVAIRHFSK